MYNIISNTPQHSAIAPAFGVSESENPDIDKCKLCPGHLGNQRSVVAVPCTHIFHKTCIDQYLKAEKDKACPSCSRSITHCLSPEKMPLHVAAAKGQADAVSNLLAHGANVNGSTKDGLTPLHCAAIQGDAATIKCLVSHGASGLTSGMNPLYSAFRAVDRFFSHDVSVNALAKGMTPLHSAIKAGQDEAVKALLTEGADTKVLIGEGKSLLSWAKDEGKLTQSLVKILAHATCDTVTPCKGMRADLLGALTEINDWKLFDKVWANTPDADIDKLQCPGSSQLAFFRSVECGQPDNIKAMIDRGADVNARNGNNETPLHCAASKGDAATIEFLVCHGAKVNALTNGMTPLHFAAQHGQLDAIECLLEFKANINCQVILRETPIARLVDEAFMAIGKPSSRSTYGITPLYSAIEAGQEQAVNALLTAGADTEQLIGYSRSLLSWAKYKKKLTKSMVENLAHATCDTVTPCKGMRADLLGALIDIKDWTLFDKVWANTQDADIDKLQCLESSQLAFYRSVEWGQPDNIKAMIARGADVNARNGNNDETPLYRAVDKGQPESIAVLIAANADVNATTRNGWTALHLAARRGKAFIAQQLIDAKANVDASISNGGEQISLRDAVEKYKRNRLIGGTPLHFAVQSCEPEIVKQLIAANADVNACNSAGHAPLQVARMLCRGTFMYSLLTNDSSAYFKFEDYENIIQLLSNTRVDEYLDHANPVDSTS
ncbi:ankyrin repeat domain-containing protein [Endozoicomonas sp. ONNA2]|uniref:ankyrin repeat domain-containing protein n=1 Tax=Endozoicomonas sp. ONNA2 TaxID=2828741 RepID=UPI002148B824|nr:ankyrin repeat domain-containing protein [Endozoicomonas sp. ONNA2]